MAPVERQRNGCSEAIIVTPPWLATLLEQGLIRLPSPAPRYLPKLCVCWNEGAETGVRIAMPLTTA